MNRPLKSVVILTAIIGSFNFLTVVSFLYFGTLTSDDRTLRLLMMLVGSFVAALFCVAVVFYVSPVLREYLITFRRLLHYDSLSHPLLVRLATQAPGTYHHSLAIANLAHRVARAVGADPILTRLGAYYHDVGKIKNPLKFVENQPAEKHSTPSSTDYRKAAQEIIAHVQDGVHLAREYHLPDELMAFIPQHHGTTVMRYYFDRALEDGQHPQEDDFRYGGPKPLTLEAVLVMLADAIEAKVRATEAHGRQALLAIVNEVIDEREDDDQFSLVNLSSSQRDKIKTAFADALLVMHHRRLKYPADLKREAHQL